MQTIPLFNPNSEGLNSERKILKRKRRYILIFEQIFLISIFLKKFIENNVVENKLADLLLLLLLLLLSGLVIFHTRHKNAKGPFHMVHSENWLVYCLYNTKSRRYELTVLELYDGYTERNRYNFGQYTHIIYTAAILKKTIIQ